MMPKGPCVLCGDTDYNMSFGGPSICPSCDCGTPPEENRLRKRLTAMSQENIQFHLALLSLLGKTGGFTKHMEVLAAATVSAVREGRPLPPYDYALRVLGPAVTTPAGEPTSDDAREGLRAGDEGRQSPDRDA